jgi:hypothetical protein
MHLSLSPSRFTAARLIIWLSAAGLLALAGYLLFAPTGLNECPHLAKSLYYSRVNSQCIQAGRVAAVAGSVVGSIGAAGAALFLRRRDDV